MKILFLSDTHGQHQKLKDMPKADMLIHAGDISWSGTGKEVVDFVEWLGSLDYKYKIFIAGNHDSCLEGKTTEIIQCFLSENCFYLCNSGMTIENIKIWGVPFFFSDDINGLFPQMVTQIPLDTDLLITHCPPLGILDQATLGLNMGNEDLLKQVKQIKPQYHLFGHIHEAYGICESDQTTFVNGSIMNDSYLFVNQPIIIKV